MGIKERRARDFNRREEEILTAALDLLDHDDWRSVTIAQIAARAEIGKGTIYKHFASKEEIYARLSLDFGEDLLRRMLLVDQEQPVADLLRELIGMAWAAHAQGRRHHRVLMFCRALDFRRRVEPATRDALESKDAQFDQLFFGIIARGMEEGLFPRRPLEELIWGPRAAFEGAVVMLWNEMAEAAVEEKSRFIDAVTQFILAGMTHMEPRSL